MEVSVAVVAVVIVVLLAAGGVAILAVRQRNQERSRSLAIAADRDRIAHAAAHDDVTGLADRAQIVRLADQRLQARSNVGVLVIELDGLQRIGDSYGHDVHDVAIRALAERLRTLLGSFDVGARIGTDTFAALLRGIRSALQAEDMARRIVQALAEPVDAHGVRLAVTVNVGVAVSEDRPDAGGKELLHDAAIAAARARGQRGPAVAVFDDRDRQAVRDRHLLERDLRHAVARGEMELHLQPLVAADNLLPHGFEALIRWRHPERGMVSPATFIPIAEESGAIIDIGTWVIEEGCRVLRRLHERSGSAAPYVSLNVSGHQLMDPRLPMIISSAIGASGAAPGRLVVEVTESVMMDDIDTGLIALEELIAMGIGVALDDFGTGYSSLSYLSRVPATHLKVDRSFVQRVGAGTADRRIVGAVIALARSLGLRVVAEGVETREEAETLDRLGADMLQGYWVARPMPADEAIDWFIQQQGDFAPTTIAAEHDSTLVIPDTAERHG